MPADRTKVHAKIEPARQRNYIQEGAVESLACYFYVSKREDNIRMVYNGTSRGLNECLLAPHFGLPTIQHTMRSLKGGYHQADLNIGKMFLNFTVGDQVHPFSGVDISHVKVTQEDTGENGMSLSWLTGKEDPRTWERKQCWRWE
jgi:hypothetical protein